MLKIIFGLVFTATAYYVLRPLFGGRVPWQEAANPDDERIRHLELTKKINLKALKDIEFELAAGKINDQDYEDLRDHYMHKVSSVMHRLEELRTGGKSDKKDDWESLVNNRSDVDNDGEDEEVEAAAAAAPGDAGGLEQEAIDEEQGLETDEYSDEHDDDDYEDEYDDDHDEYTYGPGRVARPPGRSPGGRVMVVAVITLAVGFGLVVFQMGRKSATVEAPRVAYAPQAVTVDEGEAGLEHLVEYVEKNPWNVTSHLILGEYYFDTGDMDQALTHFTSAEQVAPGNGRVLSDLGRAYRKLGDTDRAIEKFQAAVDAEPDMLEHLYQLGLVFGYDKGDTSRARELFQQILSRQPDEELRIRVKTEMEKLGTSKG